MPSGLECLRRLGLGLGLVQVPDVRIARARALREAALANGAAQVIGVTKYVDADVRPAPVEAADAAPSPVERVCEPLTPIRFAAAFEEAAQ